MSIIRYLFDENMDPGYRATLQRRRPGIDVVQVGDVGAPPHETPDQELLVYCERTFRILVTNNRKSMPGHLQEHWGQGGVCWGILWIKPGTTYDRLAEELELIWGTMEAEEWRDVTIWVPAFT